jgi:hypothetical protein
MYYIERDEQGRIIQVERVPFHAMTEQSEVSTAEIDEWMRQEKFVRHRYCNCARAILRWFACWKI